MFQDGSVKAILTESLFSPSGPAEVFFSGFLGCPKSHPKKWFPQRSLILSRRSEQEEEQSEDSASKPDEVLFLLNFPVHAPKSPPHNYSSTASFSTVSNLLTLFSKFFSPFLRSTCSLSVSHKYLALEEVYLPFRAAIPNNPTLRIQPYSQNSPTTGFSPSVTPCSKGLMRVPCLPGAPLDYNSTTVCYGFTFWAFACSLAATEAILVSFFSSA